jgi:DNA-binding MarR family transcriptional regulator
MTMTVQTSPKSEECNCFALRSAARRATQLYDQFLTPIGLRTTQFSILAKLKRRGPLAISALAEDMVMDRTAMGRAVQPLERDGLIRIERAVSDRRVKEVHLTKSGEKRLQESAKAWSQAQARFEADFGAGRASKLRALLLAVVSSQFTPQAQIAER